MENTSPTPDEKLGSSSQPVGKPRIRVMIADDHPIVRDGIRRLLALEDDIDVVAEAADGREVLELLQNVEVDVILLDLRMPGMDGLTA